MRGLEQQRGESDAATRELGEARSRVENLSQRVTDLDRQLIIQIKEPEYRQPRQHLGDASCHQGKLLANAIMKTSLAPVDAAARTHRKGIARRNRRLNGGKAPAIEKLRAEKAALEEQLRIARDDASKLQRDINAIQQQPKAHGRPSAWKMRCCANASTTSPPKSPKLAIQLEGPNSPIRGHAGGGTEMPAKATRPANGATANAGVPAEGGGTLASASRRCNPASAPPAAADLTPSVSPV